MTTITRMERTCIWETTYHTQNFSFECNALCRCILQISIYRMYIWMQCSEWEKTLVQIWSTVQKWKKNRLIFCINICTTSTKYGQQQFDKIGKYYLYLLSFVNRLLQNAPVEQTLSQALQSDKGHRASIAHTQTSTYSNNSQWLWLNKLAMTCKSEIVPVAQLPVHYASSTSDSTVWLMLMSELGHAYYV